MNRKLNIKLKTNRIENVKCTVKPGYKRYNWFTETKERRMGVGGHPLYIYKGVV